MMVKGNSGRCLVVLILAAAVCILYLICARYHFVRKVPAGVCIEYRVKPGSLPRDPLLRDRKMGTVIETMRQRIGGGCVRDYSIQLEKNDTIIVELPGVMDGKETAEIIRENDDLEFYHMEDVKSERNCNGKWQMKLPTKHYEGYAFHSVKDGITINGDSDPKLVLQKVVNAYDPATNPYGTKPCLTGKNLLPNATAFSDSRLGPSIGIQFDPAGTKVFQALARSHKEECLGVFYDGRMVASIVICKPEADGSVYISGFSSLSRAEHLAAALNAGAMPVSLEIMSISKSPEHYAF